MLFYLSLLETEEQKKNFIEIYGRNRGNMYCVAQGILGQKEEAENAVHDAFAKLADKFRRYEGLSEKEMDGLCITIARNTAINLFGGLRAEDGGIRCCGGQKKGLHFLWMQMLLRRNYLK